MKNRIKNAINGKNGIALGAGIGMIIGWVFDNAGFGLVLGASTAWVFGLIFQGDSDKPEA